MRSACAAGGRTRPAIGFEDALELCLLDVLQHHALRPFFMDDPLIVRQIEGSGSDAVRAVAGREDLVHHPDRGRRAQLGIPVARIDGQIILDFLEWSTRSSSGDRFPPRRG